MTTNIPASHHRPASSSARYAVARRHEQDCWDALTRHTSRCPACRQAWLDKKQHGMGCEEGRACRDEWIIASNRKYELSGMVVVKNTCPA